MVLVGLSLSLLMAALTLAQYLRGNQYPALYALSGGVLIAAAAVLMWMYRNYNGEVDPVKQRIQKERYLSDAVINSLPGVFYLYDDTGRFIRWNRNFEVASGYSSQDVRNMHPLDFFADDEKDYVRKKIESVFRGGTEEVEAHFVTKDGKKIPYYFNGSLVNFEGHTYLVGMGIDVAEKKRAEDAVRHTHREKEMTLNRISDSVVSVDHNWRYTFLNDAALAAHPLGREGTIGRTMLEIHPELEGTEFWSMYRESMQTMKVLATENYYEPMNVWFSARAYPSPEGLTIFYTDVTERKLAEDKIRKLNEELEIKVVERTAELNRKITELRESDEKFIKAFHASPAGITLTRLSDYTYLDVNEAFAELTGYSREELIGKTVAELGLIAVWRNKEEHMRLILGRGWVRNIEVTARAKSGKLLEILTSVETITLNNEKYTINIVHDVTERKRAEEQLAAVNKELESFSYSVSHDLRAPLRALIGYSQLLSEDYAQSFDESGKKILASIARNASKMNQLIADLLEFSRLGKKELQKSETDVDKLVKDILAEITESTPHKATIKVAPLKSVYADKMLLTQVWTNLISNALKYSSRASEPMVEIGLTHTESEVTYFVKDNGAGFDMDFADKLFGVFQRLHSDAEFQGTGIGLSIVKRVVTRHGGRVWAEGKVNAGACFFFTLPRR